MVRPVRSVATLGATAQIIDPSASSVSPIMKMRRCPKPVRKPAAGQHQCREKQIVDVNDPLQCDDARIKIAPDLFDRKVDH